MIEQHKSQITEMITAMLGETHDGDLNYIYRGEFTQTITENILSLTERNINTLGMPSRVKKRVFYIMVETLQNITRHTETKISVLEKSSLFIVQKKKSVYFITTANIIENTKIEKLAQRLEIINSLNEDELKLFYKEILTFGKMSDKGGAGLGLIEMARKSGNKLDFKFKQIDEHFSFFYLQTYIYIDEDVETAVPKNNISLGTIVELHEHLNANNVFLVYNSIFNQESLIGLIAIIEQQIKHSNFFKKQLFNIMVEMFQNIIHHSEPDRTKNYRSDAGVFTLSQKNNFFMLSTINYIRNSNIQTLKQKLDEVNDMSHEELDNFYNRRLFDFGIDTSRQAGLGIIDMRMKSNEKFQYSFNTLDEEYSIFHLRLRIKN